MTAHDFMPDDAFIAGIKARLERIEAERRSATRAVSWRAPLFIGLLLVAVVGLALFFNSFADPNEKWLSALHVFLYAIAAVVGLVLFIQTTKPARSFRQSSRDRILPMVFGFIKDLNYRHDVTPQSFDRMPLETVGAFNRESFDDVISGRCEEFAFELYEATLREKSLGSDVTTFKGIVVAFETMTPFPGVLVATRKTGKPVGFLRGLFGGGLEELQSGMPALDEAYEFRTDNVDAARPLVTGRLAQALQWLGETWPEQPARVALKGSDGFLLIPIARNFFELPENSTPLDYKAHVAPMIADMASLLATASLVRKAGEADDVARM